MISTLAEFVDELRVVGIPVSMVEAIDAAEAIEYTDLGERENLRATLGATLVKNPRHYPAFDRAFDVYFRLEPIGDVTSSSHGTPQPADGSGAGAGGSDGLLDSLVEALMGGSGDQLRRLVANAVDRYAGMQPGRPVGGRYYAYRVLRRIDTEELMARLIAALIGDGQVDGLDARIEVERAIRPLARKLATRLGQRRRHGAKGRLDVRRTIRRSLGHGGVLLEPQFKRPRKSKPEIVILCDVSGSMATFARFTMQLTYAISAELAKVRVFAFIDGLDEVTDCFSPNTDFAESLITMSREADIVRRDGHSDYGRSFNEMWDRYADAVTSRSTVIITGDARNNYRDAGLEAFERVVNKSKATFWLNPEPRRFWDTGDSVMSTYSEACDSVDQVRTLRQLEAFVERATLPIMRRRMTAS